MKSCFCLSICFISCCITRVRESTCCVLVMFLWHCANIFYFRLLSSAGYNLVQLNIFLTSILTPNFLQYFCASFTALGLRHLFLVFHTFAKMIQILAILRVSRYLASAKFTRFTYPSLISFIILCYIIVMFIYSTAFCHLVNRAMFVFVLGLRRLIGHFKGQEGVKHVNVALVSATGKDA